MTNGFATPERGNEQSDLGVTPYEAVQNKTRSSFWGAATLAIVLWGGASASAAVVYDANPANPLDVAAAHTLNNF